MQNTPSKLNICILNRVKGLKMSNSLNKKSMKCYTQKMLAWKDFSSKKSHCKKHFPKNWMVKNIINDISVKAIVTIL